MENIDFFSEQENQKKVCHNKTTCELCEIKKVCLLSMGRSPASIFNAGKQFFLRRLDTIRNSNKDLDLKNPDSEYMIGMYNGIESVLAYLEVRTGIYKAVLPKKYTWKERISIFLTGEV